MEFLYRVATLPAFLREYRSDFHHTRVPNLGLRAHGIFSPHQTKSTSHNALSMRKSTYFVARDEYVAQDAFAIFSQFYFKKGLL